MNIQLGSKRHIVCSVLVAAFSALFVGCAVDGTVDDSEVVEEVVGEAESAFEEDACRTETTGLLTATDGTTCWTSNQYDSPNASYGTANCTNAFIVKLDGLINVNSYAFPAIGNPLDADTEAECDTITARMRRWRGTSSVDSRFHGDWKSWGECWLTADPGNSPSFSANDEDRFVLQAFKNSTKIKVGLEVHGPEC